MTGLATNVLVRYVMQDDARQSALATRLIEALSAESPGFVSLGRALEEAGLMRLSQAFTPHLTLLYDAQRVESVPIAPITWTVREFSLVHTLIGRSRHTVLERWSLRG